MSELPNSTNERHPIVAVVYSFLAPGLGLIYVGRLLLGICINLLFVLLALCFFVALSLWKFFPLFPAIVLISSWLVLCALSAWRALEIIAHDEAGPPRGYQHPLFYALLALVTFAAPLAVAVDFANRHLFSLTVVDTMGLYPHARPGDHLFIDRTTYRDEGPKRGDLVALRLPDTGELAIRRIVAIPKDEVTMHGYTIVINDKLIDYTPLDPEWVTQNQLELDADIGVWVEHNHDRRYVVSMTPGTTAKSSISSLKLGEDAYFVLADNRSPLAERSDLIQDADSRVFGPISRESIEGSPLYIAWSSHPETGSTRWNRIGLSTD